MLDRSEIQGLLFYFEHSAELDPGIQMKVTEVLEELLTKMDEEAAAAKRKRKSPNKSGIFQIDPETGKIVGEYATQKEALAAIDKEGKSGIGDALNGRNKTHMAPSISTIAPLMMGYFTSLTGNHNNHPMKSPFPS